MKKILLSLSLLFVLAICLQMASAISNLPPVKQGQCTQLIQTCDNCSYVNLTTYQNVNGNILNINKPMQQLAPSSFNYTWCNNTAVGTVIYCASGNPDGLTTTQCTSYDITPNGQTNNIWFWILLIGIIYGIGFFGYFGKNEWVSIIGGFGMVALGVYIVNNGIGDYRDTLTLAVSTLTIGLGALFSIHAGVEVIQENV